MRGLLPRLLVKAAFARSTALRTRQQGLGFGELAKLKAPSPQWLRSLRYLSRCESSVDVIQKAWSHLCLGITAIELSQLRVDGVHLCLEGFLLQL